MHCLATIPCGFSFRAPVRTDGYSLKSASLHGLVRIVISACSSLFLPSPCAARASHRSPNARHASPLHNSYHVLSQRQRFPQGIDPFLRGFVHHHLIRPRPRKTFRSPLARRVDPHLRSEVLHACRVIQRIHRTHHKLHVPLRIQRAQRLPDHLPVVVDIHFVVHHHDHLPEHPLPHRPTRIHNLPTVP